MVDYDIHYSGPEKVPESSVTMDDLHATVSRVLEIANLIHVRADQICDSIIGESPCKDTYKACTPPNYDYNYGFQGQMNRLGDGLAYIENVLHKILQVQTNNLYMMDALLSTVEEDRTGRKLDEKSPKENCCTNCGSRA